MFHNSCIISSLCRCHPQKSNRTCTISGNEHPLICTIIQWYILTFTKREDDSKQKYIHTYIYTYIQYIHKYVRTYIYKYINSIINTYVHSLPELQASSNVYANIHTYIHMYIHEESCLFYEPDLLFRRRYFRISGACSEAADPSAKVRSPCGSTTSSLNNISMPWCGRKVCRQ